MFDIWSCHKRHKKQKRFSQAIVVILFSDFLYKCRKRCIKVSSRFIEQISDTENDNFN